MDGILTDGRRRWLTLAAAALLVCSFTAAAPAQDGDAAATNGPAIETVQPGDEDAAPAETAPDADLEQQEQPPDLNDSVASVFEAVSDVLDVDTLAVNPWWRWVILFGAIFAGVLVGRIVQSILRRVGGGLIGRGWTARGRFFSDAAAPANLLIVTVALSSGLAQLQMGDALRSVIVNTMQLLLLVAIFWYAFNLVSIVEVMLYRMTEKTNSKLNDQLVPVIRKTLRIFLVVVAILFVAQNIFNQDIGAWLAGLGIAGLAVSLAAQDSLKNLFGSITILFDKPFQVGERISYSGYDGVIEDIGFRSTKVRTLSGHLVNIPNSRIVNDPIENIAQRPTIRRILNVTITYDTPLAKIREGVQIIRDILDEEGIREPINPTVNGDVLSPRVHFNEFNAASLNIFVIYWYAPPVWWDYLAHAEQVNLRIFEEFEKAGIDFAFPTQTLHLANDAKRQLALRMLDANGSPTEGGI